MVRHFWLLVIGWISQKQERNLFGPGERLLRRGDYIRGSFVRPEVVDGYVVGVNPGDRDDDLGRFTFSKSSVDACVYAANRAKTVWQSKKLADRCAAIRTAREYLSARQERIAVLITRETGKPIWESQQEVVATIRTIDLFLDDGLPYLASKIIDPREARSEQVPRGVVGIITPYNMPLLLPMTQVCAALLSGNVVVLKTSKFTPGTGQLISEVMDRCKLPRGAFNAFQGSGVVNGARLAAHPDLDALLFSGSYRTAQKVGAILGKRPELPMMLQTGGKGCALVIEGCDLERAVYETLVSTFLTSGQRYNSTGRVIVTRTVFDAFCKSLVRRAKMLKVGYGMERETFVGPLISEAMRKKYLKYSQAVHSKGHSALLPAMEAKMDRRGFYVRPAIHWVHWEKGGAFLNDEPPGPTLLVYQVDTWEEAIALHNRLEYRPAAALFVDPSHTYFDEMKRRIVTGSLNINRGTIGSSIRLPSSGRGRASNGFASGLELLRFLSTQRAVLEDTRPFDPQTALPGMRWNDRSEEPTDLGAAQVTEQA